MISSRSLVSASGLRPMSAFVVISAVILCVGAKVALIAGDGEERLARVVEERGERPAYSIFDAEGRPLAHFVQRCDLEMSPQSMWQAQNCHCFWLAVLA